MLRPLHLRAASPRPAPSRRKVWMWTAVSSVIAIAVAFAVQMVALRSITIEADTSEVSTVLMVLIVFNLVSACSFVFCQAKILHMALGAEPSATVTWVSVCGPLVGMICWAYSLQSEGKTVPILLIVLAQLALARRMEKITAVTDTADDA